MPVHVHFVRLLSVLAILSACGDAPPTAPASRANIAQGNAADCTTEDAVEFALIAAHEAKNAAEDIESLIENADSTARVATIAADSVARAAYDSVFASLHVIFGAEAIAAYDLYVEKIDRELNTLINKHPGTDASSWIDTTLTDDGRIWLAWHGDEELYTVEAGKYLFHGAGVNLPYSIHRLNESEKAVWESEYSAAWDRFEAAGEEAAETAGTAAHHAACTLYKDTILSLDTKGTSVAYHAAVLAFSAELFNQCAENIPSTQFYGLAFGSAGRLDQAASYNVKRTASMARDYAWRTYSYSLDSVKGIAENAALLALALECQ